VDGRLPEGFAPALARLDRRLEREILRLRARYALSLDEFRGLYVSDEQVDAMVAAAPAGLGDQAAKYEPLAVRGAPSARWGRVVEAFALSPLEQDLLLMAFAPDLDLKYETLYAYLNNDVTRKWPTVDLARRVLGAADTDPQAWTALLAPGGRLRAQGLVQAIDPPASRPSHLNEGFALDPIAVRFLLGATPLAAADRESMRAWDGLLLSPDQVSRLRALTPVLAAPKRTPPAILLVGERGCGRRQVARALAASLGMPLRELDFAQARRKGIAPCAALEPLLLELRLQPAALHVRGLDGLFDREGHLIPDARGLLDEPALASLPLLLSADGACPWRDLLGGRRALRIELGLPDYPHRRRLWERTLADAGIALAPAECAELAGRFRLAPAGIRDAVATALDWAAADAGGHGADAALLGAAARGQSDERLGSLASKVAAQHDWSQLVLPPQTLARLKELCAAIRCRHVVYAEWGFAERVVRGIGIKALFAGASGTGKTMAASVIARRLGLDLYKIDLAGLVSKYIGETEKNLDRIFAAAHSANAVLFFDEADALFGKRSEVKDAHDRYANVEVAYLLQKLEDHDGVVILASNLKRNIDDAFARRLHYVIDFPQPDTAQRELLWRGMFPERAPRSLDVDFGFLARRFDLAGGDIRNVVLDAAFLAAQDGGRIGMPQLVRALARQMAKQGKSPSRSDFERYFGLLDMHAAPAPGPHVRGAEAIRP
jgi:AAA+ superfamily predicted ATPase